ncbi:uncharacterized protein BXZ73DRAFT_73471 [Epithele typhae]|uniref:uncharacterized protein n=1 Tax=Epithele typhae TaxID=378194 RepID=UPI002007FF3A|nr:uncharacterized protein BXZ73DRAFT_73471 [Epithele typhae]KAH9945313.1 hypothetical protein BXZ73DRAFT_73471 [Epithele typhae]
MSSSKRGRKRNDNLPPNRARDVQRAFRARRAAHLEALESRVSELEEENNALRAALNLPPANRPALGKGPTGKDKPKNGNAKDGAPNVSALLSNIASGGGSLPPMSRTESPLSTGSGSAHSMSPDPIGPGLSLPQASSPNALDPANWNDSMFGEKDSDRPSTNSFNLSSSASHNSSPFPQLPRPPTHDIFAPQAFSAGDDKSFGYLPSEERRSFNGFSHLLGAQSSLPPSIQSGGDDSDLAPYLQRRALTEPDGFRTLLQMAHAGSQHGLGQPSRAAAANALLSVVDTPLAEFDPERRYPRLR